MSKRLSSVELIDLVQRAERAGFDLQPQPSGRLGWVTYTRPPGDVMHELILHERQLVQLLNALRGKGSV